MTLVKSPTQYRVAFTIIFLSICPFLCCGFHIRVIGANRAKAGFPSLGAHSNFASDDHFLMDKYRDPTTGEVMDPYEVLKIPRSADRQEIKSAYRSLSRRYHPDGMINRDILPGSCNSLEDVRDQWERVKLSNEILSDPLSRKRYDRNEAIADPGRAVQRAASRAAADTAVSVGKGLWELGASFLREAAKAATKVSNEYNKITRGTGDSTRIIKRRSHISPETRRKYIETAFRSRIDQSFEVARTNSGPALFSKIERKERSIHLA